MTDDDIRKMTNLEFHLWLYENRKEHNYTKPKSSAHGVGINDTDYAAWYKTSDGKQIVCPCYKTWHHMIGRCYSKKMQERWSTYIGTKVHPEWLHFSHFREWWIKNYLEGGSIDKDILYHPLKHGPEKIYSPETCIYIPGWLNSFATSQPAGKYGRGIHKERTDNNFTVILNNHATKTKTKIYSFKTPEEAYVIYLKTKLSIIKSMKKDLDNIHPDLYMGLIRHIMSQPRF